MRVKQDVSRSVDFFGGDRIKAEGGEGFLFKKRSGFITCRKMKIKCKQSETQSQLTTA